MSLALLGAAVHAEPPADAVEVREGSLSLPYLDALSIGQVDPANPRAMQPLYGTERATQRTFKTVELSNVFLKVVIVPEMGGAIARATFLPTGDDLFFFEGQAKNYLPYWESGARVSFPFREHGLQIHQPAGWRVVRHADGAATFAAWMEFARFDAPQNRWIYGRYSTMLLSQQVTLRPGRGTFSATWRIVNPTPYRQGRRLWSDAIFPREHDEHGAVQGRRPPPMPTRTEWISPAAWVSGHGGSDLRRYDRRDTRLAQYDRTMSIFPWDMKPGFSGLWYPRVRVNRLVMWDAAVSPGAKQWFDGEQADFDEQYSLSFKYNLVELWVGSDSVFEGVEQWLGPGQAYGFTQHYAYVPGIGKADYADQDLAVNVELDAATPTVEVATFAPAQAVNVAVDGRTLDGAQPCGPARPARWTLPARQATTQPVAVQVHADGRLLLDRRFPLEIADDTSRHAAIRAACQRTPEQAEKDGNNAHFGETFREAMAQYPAGSLGRGRCQYRDGYLPAAEATLRAAAADPAQARDAGEASTLLAMCLWEQQRPEAEVADALAHALAATPAYLPARYWQAVLALRRGDGAAATRDLRALVTADAHHWEGRVLLAWVLSTTDDPGAAPLLADLEAADPADPRLAWVTLELLKRTGATPADVQAQEAVLAQLLNEPGATQRVHEFRELTRGRYVPPRRLGY